MKNNLADLLTSNFRDNGNLPLVGNLSSKVASFFSAGVYAIALVTFIVSFVSYSTFDSLKNQVTSISTTPGDNCIIISAYSATYLSTRAFTGNIVRDAIVNFDKLFDAPAPSNPPNPLVSLTGGRWETSVQYLKMYFATYDACIAAFSTTDPYVFRGSSSVVGNECTMSFSKFNADIDVLGTTSSSSADPCTQISVDVVKNKLYSVFTADIMCSPYQNFPPYQCTTLQPTSTLAILSQSFALTTTVIAVLFFIAAFQVKARAKPEPPVTKLDYSADNGIHTVYPNA